MSRLINLALFCFVLLGAFWLYQVKHQAKVTENRIAEIEAQIAAEKEALLLLKAEWSYLNRPERVQRLAERFSEKLGLKAVQPYQVGIMQDLPDRPAESERLDEQGPSEIGELLGRVSAHPNSLSQSGQ